MSEHRRPNPKRGLGLRKAERQALDKVDASTRLKKHLLLAEYSRASTLAAAAKAASIPYGDVIEWVRDARSSEPMDKGFAELFHAAESHAVDVIEDEIRRRAIEGETDYVTSNGEIIWLAFSKATGDPLPTARMRDGGIEVTTQDGLVLGPEDYIVRPLTTKRRSDRLLLALARARCPERWGWKEWTKKSGDEDKEGKGTLKDLIRRFEAGETGTDG